MSLTPEQLTQADYDRVNAVRVTPEPPADFMAFWQEVVAELETTPLDLETKDGEWRATSLDGRRIGGTYTIPEGDWKQGRPQWVNGHGYAMIQGSGRFAVQDDPEWICVSVDARGHGRSRTDGDPSFPGWAIEGIESPYAYIVRGAVADWMRAVQVARLMPGADPDLTLLTGGSLGGGLTTLAAPWIQNLLGIMTSVPTFGAYDLRRSLVKRGSGHEVNQYLANLPQARAEQVRENLRYFDAVNAAPLIQVPALVGLGVVDAVVPGETVAAIYHALGSEKKELLSFPCSHLDHPLNDEWNRFEAYGRAWARRLVERRRAGRS